jgi:hypothetical protein
LPAEETQSLTKADEKSSRPGPVFVAAALRLDRLINEQISKPKGPKIQEQMTDEVSKVNNHGTQEKEEETSGPAASRDEMAV